MVSQFVPQKLPQGQRIGDPPVDAALRAQTLEVAHHQHAKVDPGRDARPAARIGVVGGAQLLDKVVEAMRCQDLIELFVKWMPRRLRQRAGLHKQLLLPTPWPFTHRHTGVSSYPLASYSKSRKALYEEASSFLPRPDFFNGLLGYED